MYGNNNPYVPGVPGVPGDPNTIGHPPGVEPMGFAAAYPGQQVYPDPPQHYPSQPYPPSMGNAYHPAPGGQHGQYGPQGHQCQPTHHSSSGLSSVLSAGMAAAMSHGGSGGNGGTGSSSSGHKSGKTEMVMGLASHAMKSGQQPQQHPYPGGQQQQHYNPTADIVGIAIQSGGSKSAIAKGLAGQVMHKPPH